MPADPSARRRAGGSTSRCRCSNSAASRGPSVRLISGATRHVGPGAVLAAQRAGGIGPVRPLPCGRRDRRRDRAAQFPPRLRYRTGGRHRTMRSARRDGGRRQTWSRERSFAVTLPGTPARTARVGGLRVNPRLGPPGADRVQGRTPVIPTSASMTSASVPGIVIPPVSLRRPFSGLPSRAPSRRRRHDPGDQLDRSQDIGMGRIDRMPLDRQIGPPGQPVSACTEAMTSSGVPIWMSIAAILSCTDMPAKTSAADRGVACSRSPQPDRGQMQRLPPSSATNTVREARMRGARPGQQRLQIGVDHRVLDVGQRQIGRSAGRGCVRDSISPSPAAPARRAPSTENVACQTRSGRLGSADKAGRRRAAPPGQASRSTSTMPDQHLCALRAVLAECRCRPRRSPLESDTDLQPEAAQQIEHRGILRDPDRQFQRQCDDAGSEPDARGARSGLRQEHERRRQTALVLVKMVLRNPGRVEAALLGMHDLREGQTVALGRVHPIQQAKKPRRIGGRSAVTRASSCRCGSRRAGARSPAYRRGRARSPLSRGGELPRSGIPPREYCNGIACARRSSILIRVREPCPLVARSRAEATGARNCVGENVMFSHVMIGSNDVARSKKFYDALFVVMGGSPPLGRPGPAGRRAQWRALYGVKTDRRQTGHQCQRRHDRLYDEQPRASEGWHERASRMAAPRSRTRPGSAKGPPARCISLICATPTATRSSRPFRIPA